MHCSVRVGAFAVLVATGLATLPARGAEPEQEDQRLSVHWRPMGLWDYVATAGILLTYYAIEVGLDMPRGADWKEPLPLVDQPGRDYFALSSRAARRRADSHSDIAWYVSTAYPALAGVIVPVARGASWDVPLELTMMNIQGFGAASIAIRVPHKLVGRMRPNYQGCQEDPSYSTQCGTGAQYLSFWGGHSGISMAGAGLSCAHHLHARLLGHEFADALACGTLVGVGLTVGVFRMRADKHWLSDILIADAVGFALGYGLPTLLYYRPFWRASSRARPRGRDQSRVWVVPFANDQTLGMVLRARW
jgi:hypothetical protein